MEHLTIGFSEMYKKIYSKEKDSNYCKKILKILKIIKNTVKMFLEIIINF